MKHATLKATALTAALVVAVTPWLRARDEGPLETFERLTLDLRFTQRGPRAVHPDVALVVFDDATAEQAGPLFERRAGWAQVIDAIATQHPKAIGIDAVFDVPERLLGDELQRDFETWKAAHPDANGDEEQLLARVANELAGDAVLARSLHEAGNVVLIVSATGAGTEAGGLSRGRYGQSTPGPDTRTQTLLTPSQTALNAAAKGLGLALVAEDQTHTARFFDFGRVHQEAVMMPLAVAMAAVGAGLSRAEVAYLGPTNEVSLGERTLRLERGGQWLDFAGPRAHFPTYSALDVVRGKVPADTLKGKHVLLGVTRFGYDLAESPFGAVPGVELQAAMLDQVLSGQALRRTSPVFDLATVLLLGVAMSLLFASPRVGPRARALGSLALLAAWLVAAQVAFSQSRWWAPVVLPSLQVLLCLLVGLAVSYVTEAGQRRQLKKAFDHYVGEDVLDELIAHPEKLALGGEKRDLTVIFSDIRDFTTLSEKLSPVELVRFLNTYLSPMTKAVLRNGGLLDKYIGDAVMGVFGAPVPREEHAAQALRCVARMHEELAVLNAGPLKQFGLEVAIGCGVNSGPMVVGNMGSEERFDYTVAGDAVNLSSRLEGLSKVYGVFCLVGEGTRKQVSEGFVFRELDLVQVKGKHEAVAVFELLSVDGVVLSRRERLDAWDSGLTAFRAGRLPEARIAFTSFAEVNPNDLSVQRYLERLAELPEQAPADFSAVSAFKTK